jgi:hypothetical protein
MAITIVLKLGPEGWQIYSEESGLKNGLYIIALFAKGL